MRPFADRVRSLVHRLLHPTREVHSVSAQVGLSRDGRALAVLDASVPSGPRRSWMLVWTHAADGNADLRIVRHRLDEDNRLRLVIPYATIEADDIHYWVVLLRIGWRPSLLRFYKRDGGPESRLLTAPWAFIPAGGEPLVYHRGTLTIHRPSCSWASPRYRFFLSPVSEPASILRAGGSVCRTCCGGKT